MTAVRRQIKPVTDSMHRLKVELIVCFDRDEAHVLALDSFRDGFRVDEVVLVRLHKGLYELCRDQTHVMALLLSKLDQESALRSTLQDQSTTSACSP